jgi:predicted transcriptional regulator
MATTTIRVDSETHATLLELATERGTSLIDTARAAAEALRRQQFAQHVTDELNALRADPGAWADYLAEAETSHIGDGVA